MNQFLIKTAKTVLKKLNIGVAKYSSLQLLMEYEKSMEEFFKIPKAKSDQLLLLKSNSQVNQDLFVLSELDFKRNGFFVEFGATNGVDLSNTYLLEKEYDWKGILAEPARVWHDALKKNRSCHIETNCVWRDSTSKLNFNEVEIAELSTISNFNQSDSHQNLRENGQSYIVQTISLNDLLEKYDAPKIIDYLSIDTEGSEYEILNSFDFDKYQFRVISCEHNFTPLREKINTLLTSKGYARKFVGFSRWDDWYVKIV